MQEQSFKITLTANTLKCHNPNQKKDSRITVIYYSHATGFKIWNLYTIFVSKMAVSIKFLLQLLYG